MNWKDLTVGQICAMLLEEDYRRHWEKLREPLRDRNGKNRLYPLFPATYAITVTAVWHALSVGNKAPDDIDVRYLEDNYYLKNLFWDSARPKGQYAFVQYLVGHGRMTGEAEARNMLSRIARGCNGKPFQEKMTLEKLLDQLPGNHLNIPKNKDCLKEILANWLAGIPETDLPPKENPLSKPEEKRRTVPADGRAALRDKLDKTFAGDVCGMIEDGRVKQFVFTGAPGTGKTYAAELLAGYLGDRQKWTPGSSAYTLVQFHPSYDYTDFVEGLRPVTGEDGAPRFVKLDGSFKAFCRQVAAADNPGGKYFFIIDEINRAELSKVFGELMYCMEEGKRGRKNAVQTQYQNLRTYDPKRGQELAEEEDCFAGGFYIPENVYIIGTMNDIDRSVESMDFALRRRFHMLEAIVDEEMLLGAFGGMGFGERQSKELTKSVLSLNKALEAAGEPYGLNRQYDISHGQFANLPENVQKGTAEDVLEHVWKYRLENLLREYLRGVDEGRISEFVKTCGKAFKGSGTDE